MGSSGGALDTTSRLTVSGSILEVESAMPAEGDPLAQGQPNCRVVSYDNNVKR